MVPRPRDAQVLLQRDSTSFSLDGEEPSVDSQQTALETSKHFKGLKNRVPITVTLPLLVFFDMFAVSLVVPLLFQYYKEAGISSASQREWLSSLFSGSQIIGGILLGILTDAKVLARPTMLYVSFGGSALAYALIVYGSLPALVCSRILVGLVKQTMTVTTTLITHSTSSAQRAKAIGRLSAASTVAWIAGPSAGALMFKHLDRTAPPLVACALFVLNLALAALLLPSQEEWLRIEDAHSATPTDDDKRDAQPDNANTNNNPQDTKKSTLASIRKNLQAAFSSPALASVVAARLIYTFVHRAMSYSQLGSFYEDMYGLEPHHRGYLSSYQQFLSFVVQALLAGPVMAWCGGERRAAALLSMALALMIALESLRSIWLFLLVLSPITSLSMSIINLALQTLVTQVAPTHAIFSILTALDILQSVVSVSTPFYRTLLFSFLTTPTVTSDDNNNRVGMQGDPDPVAWVITSGIHWILAAAVISLLLLSSSKQQQPENSQTRKPKKQ